VAASIAVVGCGNWSIEAHLPSLAGDPRAELVAVVDPEPAARAAASARYGGAREFASVAEMLDEITPDGAVLAVPHALHGPLGLELVVAGAHLLIEKPMVLDPADGRAILAAGRERGVEVIVGYPWHFNSQAVAVRDAIARGELGELELVSCVYGSTVREYYRGNTEAYLGAWGYERAPLSTTYSDPELSGGGQGQTQLTHSAALALFLTGLEVTQVAGHCEAFELPVDLVDAISVRFGSGAIGTLSSTGGVVLGHDEVLEYRIFGRDGHVAYDVMQGRAAIHRAGGVVDALEPLPAERRYPQFEPARNLVGVALGEEPNRSPGSLGLRVVELLDAMYRSAAADGRPVTLAQ
jgi:predicted dehydrogenase